MISNGFTNNSKEAKKQMKKTETITLESWEKVTQYISSFDISLDFLNSVIQVQRELGIDMYDSMSKGQLSSKMWAIKKLFEFLDHKDSKIAVCGGWYGTLAGLALSNASCSSMRPIFYSIDIDEFCETVANKVNSRFVKSQAFCAITADMYDIDYQPYSVVVNTSCEHIPDVNEWLSRVRRGSLVVLQSNNFSDHVEHINCVSSSEEFENKASSLSKILYSGEMTIPLYTRYLIVGEK